ncbi:MAG: FtsX-like permease family protein [Myxococcales bacterium]|nr:FtsX-like permease family protein [Myxococcales bacterium]
MTLLLRLALRNLVRNARRTLLTTTVIVAAIGVLILGEGFISGVEDNIIISAEDASVGHLTVRPADYPADLGQYPVDALLDISPDQRAYLNGEATAWTARTLFQPTVIAGEDWVRARGIGYDPATDAGVFPRRLWSIEGRAPASPGDEILIAPGIASLLNLDVGQSVVLQLRTHEGAINALDVKVAGIVTTTNASLDMAGLFAPRELVARLIASSKPSHISLRLRHRDAIDEVAPRLKARFGERTELISWRSETAELLRLQGIRRRALQLLVFVLMALAAFGITNTILMAAHERVREVGTLQALGMPRHRVLQMFLVEGAIMGVFGSLLGAAWGGGLVGHWSLTPIDFSAYTQDVRMDAFSFSVLIYTHFEWSVVLTAIAFGSLISVLASVYPAQVASRMAPADAVRAD